MTGEEMFCFVLRIVPITAVTHTQKKLKQRRVKWHWSVECKWYKRQLGRNGNLKR